MHPQPFFNSRHGDRMSLIELYNSKSYVTDKNTVHCYIDKVYNNLFDNKKDATNILEIGAFYGGSATLWRDYFINAIIDIIDINPCEAILNQHRINFIRGNAYTINMISLLNKYDIIIDDGPHTFDSMVFFVQNYIDLLKPNGIAIIEDIQSYEWFDGLISFIPTRYKHQIVDLRNIKNRYDDMLLIIAN